MTRLFSAGDFRRRVERRWRDGPDFVAGDHSHNPDLADVLAAIERRPAAVLVPVVDHEAGATLLFTLRTEHLAAHAGQVAFPGGKIDAGESAEAAALREAEEEIGIDSSHIDVIGRAPDYLTGSGFHITPVLGLVRPGFRLRLNPNEVTETFEVPLGFLMDPANHRMSQRLWQGATRYFFEMPYEHRNIWGVTAGIVHMLYEELYGGDK